MINIERVGLRGPDIREFWLLLTGDIFVLNDAKGPDKALWMNRVVHQPGEPVDIWPDT